MEILKRQVKRITSIILIITILVGVLPNFGLLKETKAASESNFQAGIILRLNKAKGIWTDEYEEYKAISLDILVKDTDLTSFVLPIKFDSKKLTPAYYYVGRRDEYIDVATNAKEFTSEMNSELPNTFNANDQTAETDWSNVENGKIKLEFLDGKGESYSFKDETLICTINFIVSEEITDINEINTDLINIDEDSNSFEIYNFEKIEYKRDINQYFSLQGIDILPTVKSIAIETNPTEGNKYIHGKEIDLTGLELTATYTDNSTKTISIDDPDLKITTGEKIGAIADIENPQITFEYNGKTTILDVNIIDPVVEIEVIDEDKILTNGIDSGNDIPTDEEGLYINATTASGNTEKVPLDDERITLSSYTVDINAVPDDKKQNAGGGMQSGFQTITVTYKDDINETPVTTAFDILVNDTVGSIKISETNKPTSSFTIGDTFIKDGAITVVGTSGITYGDIDMSSDSVKVTELDGTAVDLTNITPRNLLVTFGEATVEYPITVQNKVASIRVNQDKPIKLKYDKKINEQQSAFAGITITEIMADGSEGDTKDLEFAWIDITTYDNTTTKRQELKINYPYKGKTIEGKIKVQVEDKLLGIKIENLKDEYVYKDELDYEGAELYTEYVSGVFGPIDLSEAEVSGFDNTKIGEQELTFIYNDGTEEALTKVTVNIDKAILEAPVCEQLTIVAGKAISTIEDQLPTTEYGSVIWKDGAQNLTYVEGSDNIKEVSAIYKMNDTYSPYYKDVEFTVKVKVEKRIVSSIAITKVPEDVDYIEGQDFDPTGMEITVTYNDGDKSIIDSDYAANGVTFAPSTSLQTTDEKIVVSYGGKIAEQPIIVEAKVVTKIEVTQPTKNKYVEGQNLDLTGMTITATYNDGDTLDLTAENSKYTVSPASGDVLNTVGTETITVTYIGTDIEAGSTITGTTSVEVEAKVVTKIEVTQPTKNKYVEGQNLDLTGMTVTATYNDSTSAEITNYTTNPSNGAILNTVGTETITVTYDGTDIEAGSTITGTTSVEVEAKVVTKIKVTTPPTNTEYVEGHPFDPTGMIVTAYYNDGTNAATEQYSITPAGNLGRTDTTITVTYTGADVKAGEDAPSTILNVTVKAREIEKIEITKAPDKISYFEGQSFNPAGMEITVTYNDHENPLVIKDDYKNVTFSPSLTEALKTSNTGITVTYEGYTATQAITVEEDYVESITVNYPNNFQQVGKNVDLTNTTIQKVWASKLSHGDDDTEAVTLSMISSVAIVNGKFTTPGNVEVIVTYDNGKTDKPTAKFNAVVEDAIQSITLNNIETSYWVGDEIDPNIAITVNYANPANNKTIGISSPDWSKCVIKGIDMSKPGTYTLKVAYGDYETEGKTITVKDYVKEIRVVNNKLIYKLNEDGSFNIQVNKYMASEPERAIPVIKGNYTLSVASADTSAIATNDVTVSYKNEKNVTLTATFNVQVINATAKAILETTPTTMPNLWGDTLDLTGASIKVEKRDGNYETITLPNEAVTVSAYNPNVLDKQTISFVYNYQELNEKGEMVDKTIPVEGVLNITLKDYWTGAIKISGIPLNSIKGQELNLSNAKVSKVMASGALSETTSILGSMISNFDKNTEGKQTVTVTNWGKSATFDVTVTDYITSISMNRLPNKVNYTQGESLDVTGAVLNVTKQSGRTEEIAITKEMISGYNPRKTGQQAITVNYYGYITTFIVNVKAKTTDKPTTPSRPTTPTKPSDDTPIIDEPLVPEETKKYLVTFLNYDGTVLKTEEVESGKSATAPKLKTRKGYKFTGWDKDFDVVEEDMEVTAQYEKITTIKESPKPTQTLGEKDEVKEDNRIIDTLVPATIGLAITGFLLLLIAALTKKNVEVYAIYGEDKKLIGREKISKHNNKILLDSYKSKLENATAIELRINEKTVEKLEGEIVEVVLEGKTKKYKMTDVIVMKK